MEQPNETTLSEDLTGIIADVFRENEVYLGGSSLGQGLKKAACFYLDHRLSKVPKHAHFGLPGSSEINASSELMPLEDAFYIVDLGVVVSQVYQWRKCFPRVDPFYAVKCNPDPVIVRTLAVLGTNFDCASREEIRLVKELSKDLPRQPEIIYANPCKARGHLLEAVCNGVKLVTFDNAAEVQKCASISKSIQLILRIVTDDRGSQCRLSSKFGAPPHKWRPLLAAAKKYGLAVVGVSFHVGSGCRDATRYELALKDARSIFDMAKKDFGFDMTILDIGGGFPGETHSLWNPETALDDDSKEGSSVGEHKDEVDRFMFFDEIAESVAPVIDNLFPADSGVRIIGEPGRYLVAAAATLVTSVIATRSNEVDNSFNPEPVNDQEAAKSLADMTRAEEQEYVERKASGRERSLSLTSMGQGETDPILETIAEELADYSALYARQTLSQQEADVYNDTIDLFKEGIETARDLLGPPDERQMHRRHHTVEGLNYPLVAELQEDDEHPNEHPSAFISLAAAGEAAVQGVVIQAVADSAPLQDDYAYYINDGVYGAFNNVMFDHASVRPRVLQMNRDAVQVTQSQEIGLPVLEEKETRETLLDNTDRNLYPSTVFGPTCDSIDVVARSVLLPKLQVGDWLYFQNMGAYTMAAASSFNGFAPSEKFYVCSVQPKFLESLMLGPQEEEKKEDE